MTVSATSSTSEQSSWKAVTTVAAFRAELLRLCNRGGSPLTAEEMSRRTGRPSTLFQHFLRGGPALPEWQTVQAVLTATGETSPLATTAWKRRWAALERERDGKTAMLARRHSRRRRAWFTERRSAPTYVDPGTYATDNPDGSWQQTGDLSGNRSAHGDVVDSPLNNAIASTTPSGYVAALAELQRGAGLSYGDIAEYSDGRLSKSSAHRIATSDRLPAKRTTLVGYLIGCGVTQPLEQRLWLNKWEQLRRSLPRAA
jgi:hypothetical protein